MNPAIRRSLALVAVFVVAFVAVFALRMFRGGDLRDLLPGRVQPVEFRPETFTLPELPPLEVEDTELLTRLNAEYARLTRAVVPSVVSINTVGVRTGRLMDPWGRTLERRYPTQGQGSGVIVTHEGHIITNHHVIANQTQIQVSLHDGRTFQATLIGEDSLLDIAVLKIADAEGEEFTPLKLGDSSLVEVGQMVFAVGNPFGLGETVTSGIISAKERSVAEDQRDLFQTDAAINPGNSGGPLVNLRGEIIGINVAIFTLDRERPGFQGVGFSIPSNDVRDAMEQILERGRPIRGFLGVNMMELDDEVRGMLGYTGRTGAVVRQIVPGSPAEQAGLEPRDVIIGFQNQPVQSTSQLISLVQRTRVGSEVTLRVWRDGKLMEITATIAEGSQLPQAAPGPEQEPRDGRSRSAEEILSSLGVVVRDLTLQERLRGFRGVVVTRVADDGLAEGVLQPADLILGVNHTQVDSAVDFYVNLAASAAVQPTKLHLLRDGSRLQVNLPPLPAEE